MSRQNDIAEEFYAVTIYRDPATGVPLSELWKANIASPDTEIRMAYHRVDGPARTRRDPVTGTATEEEWYRHGQLHRANGPAQIWRDPKTGIMFKEVWYRNGELHRDDGPAAIHRNRVTGEITYRNWYRDGDLLPRAVQRRLRSRVPAEVSHKPDPL